MNFWFFDKIRPINDISYPINNYYNNDHFSYKTGKCFELWSIKSLHSVGNMVYRGAGIKKSKQSNGVFSFNLASFFRLPFNMV